MGSIYVIVRPPTKRATIETVKFLEQLEFDVVFIDLPREFECYISDYLRHKNFDVFIKKISEIMPVEMVPASAIRGYEDLLRALCYLSHGRPIYCYVSNLKNRIETEFAYLSAQLVLHDIITEKISIDKWVNLLSLSISNFDKWIKEEAEYIAYESSMHNIAICIAGYDGSALKKQLSNYCESWIKYTGQPFHLPPLQTLIRMMSMRKATQQEIVRLIKEHICFIRDFIIPYGLEDGLELWSRKKLYWLRGLN